MLTSLRCCNEGALHQTTDSNTCNARNVTVVRRHKGMRSAVWDEWWRVIIEQYRRVIIEQRQCLTCSCGG